MRRRPKAFLPGLPGSHRSLASPPGVVPPTTPAQQADALEPFITSGGQTWFPSGWAEERLPHGAGAQLIASLYVPKGRVAWIKRIMVAPCAPPILVDPWRGWDGFFNLFQAAATPNAQVQRAPAQAGLWETPLAWEGYFSAAGALAVGPPHWHWSITLFAGSVDLYRMQQGIGVFDPTDPSTWYLAPNVPVPADVYSGGLPGRAINGYMSGQRVQATPSAALPCHVLCPENTTICLWAQWRQPPLLPILAQGPAGPEQPWQSFAEPVYPILPSVGQLVGYMQPASRKSAAENAAHGWGG